MSPYMRVLLLSISIPFILSFYPPLKFYHNIKALLASIGLIVLIYGIWDIIATFRGHWHFTPSGVLRFRIINLPIEEVLFFVAIPFCSIFTWEAMKFIKRKIER